MKVTRSSSSPVAFHDCTDTTITIIVSVSPLLEIVGHFATYCVVTGHCNYILVSCRYRLRPRILRDVSSVDMRTELIGEMVAMPILVAPMAIQRMAHPEGEIATAKGEG